MEKEDAEQFQLLGPFREAFNILLGSSRRKLLWALVLTLLLTLSLASLGQNFSFGPLLFKNNEKKIGGVILPGETTLPELSSEWRELFVVVAPYTPFFFALLMLSTAAVVYTVASIYSPNNQKMKLCSDVPRIWKRLTLTFLWGFMISFGFLAAIIFVYIIFFPADHKLRSWGAFVFGAILLIVVFFCFQLYIITMWYLASVVSFLEDEDYCLGAGDFSKVKWMTALALLILIISGSLGAVLGRLFGYAIVEGRRHGVGIAATAVYRTLLVRLLCFVAIMVLLTQSVLYFVCKSFHHESMDDNCSFKIHNVGDCEPLNTSSIQVEHLFAEV